MARLQDVLDDYGAVRGKAKPAAVWTRAAEKGHIHQDTSGNGRGDGRRAADEGTRIMAGSLKDKLGAVVKLEELSPAARAELVELGLLSEQGEFLEPREARPRPGFSSVEKQAITAPSVLNEAYCYPAPSSFSRGLRLEMKDFSYLLISGTASVDADGRSVHTGDFRAQCWRTYRNISALLDSEGASWKDVVKTTCYLRDIERDYKEFNEVRTAFFTWLGLDPLPASVGIQARLCREDLLIEIEALAILKRDDS